jgi:hypothetical protein
MPEVRYTQPGGIDASEETFKDRAREYLGDDLVDSKRAEFDS